MEKSTILGLVKNLSPIQVSETKTISMKEYRTLQKKMRELEIENEILKKLPSYSQKISNRIREPIIDRETWECVQEELSKSQAATVNAEKFMGIVRKHLAFEELTPHPLAGDN